MTVDLDTPPRDADPVRDGDGRGLAGLRATIADGGVRNLSHDELTDLITDARRAQAGLESAVLAAVGEVDARGSHVHDGALTAGAWLRQHTRSTPAEAAASPLVPGDTRTAARRRLDGPREVCLRFLSSPDAPRTGGGGHPHVIVTTDDSTLRVAPTGGDGPADGAGPTGGVRTGAGPSSPGGEPPSPGAMQSWVGHVTGSTARRIACDADVTTVRIGPDGEVTGSRIDRRNFTAAQRRAMIARDGDRCFWPWCDRPVAWSDGHHLVAWDDLGPTTVAVPSIRRTCAGTRIPASRVDRFRCR